MEDSNEGRTETAWSKSEMAKDKYKVTDQDEDEFDPSDPPPFRINEIRAAIPAHCWVKSPWRSLSYVVSDVLVVFGFAAVALYFNSKVGSPSPLNWVFWPIYGFAQGTMFWAFFVLGHDCGHGSFSDSNALNSVVGHLMHSSILVPYNGWRISHKTHHSNHGNVEHDESWVPLTERLYKTLTTPAKILRFYLPLNMLIYPIYLWRRRPGTQGSHYNPYSDLFGPGERRDVLTSTVCWFTMVGLLLYLSLVVGPSQMFLLYGVPYLVFVMWLDFVTYLHHHGYDHQLPWYRGKEWTFLRGGLTTVDRDYGMFNKIQHDVGTHVVHHLFPQIPHYHLTEATEAAKPVLGKYYREPKKSAGPIPWHLLNYLMKSIKTDHFVSDTGDVLFYQTDPQLFGSAQKKVD